MRLTFGAKLKRKLKIVKTGFFRIFEVIPIQLINIIGFLGLMFLL